MLNTIVVAAKLKLKNIFNLFERRLKYQRKIVDATAFVNIKTKIYYNAKH